MKDILRRLCLCQAELLLVIAPAAAPCALVLAFGLSDEIVAQSLRAVEAERWFSLLAPTDLQAIRQDFRVKKVRAPNSSL